MQSSIYCVEVFPPWSINTRMGTLTLDDHVRQMKQMGTLLLPQSFPLGKPEDEDVISCLKQREIVVDGYDLVLYFNRCRYLDVDLETLQMFGKYFSFLPFRLACKVAYKFLGDKELSFIEVTHYKTPNVMDEYARKIYVWAVYYNNQNQPIPSPFAKKSSLCNYEGFSYLQVDKEQVAFF